jgi:uncharacterized protein (DUF58 family)
VTFGITALAWAQDLTFSVKVDKTTVEIGDPITLTMTLGGDVSDVDLSQFEFPDGFSIVGRSQSTNFSIRAEVMERSVSLIYVLVPKQTGTFQLGPFTIEHRNKELTTEPVEITVEKPTTPTPQQVRPQGERFTL